jgi:hypothetical protein
MFFCGLRSTFALPMLVKIFGAFKLPASKNFIGDGLAIVRKSAGDVVTSNAL